MSANLRPDIHPGDFVILLHKDGNKLEGVLTGTDRWINPGGVPFESLDKLLQKGFEVAKHTDGRRAPVQASRDHGKPAGSIAWWEHENAWQGYAVEYPAAAYAQNAERIAERAGFGYNEVRRYLGHDPITWRDNRPPQAFRVGQKVRRRLRDDDFGQVGLIEGTVTEIVWAHAFGNNPAEWGYRTSWGSAYPARELVSLETESDDLVDQILYTDKPVPGDHGPKRSED